DDRRRPRPERRPDDRAPARRHRHARAEAGAGRGHPLVRRRTRRRLRTTRLPAEPRPALRRPRRRSLSRGRQRAEATVHPAGERWVIAPAGRGARRTTGQTPPRGWAPTMSPERYSTWTGGEMGDAREG